MERDPIESRKSELRRTLFESKARRHGNFRDGALMYKGMFQWKRDPAAFKLPRSAEISVISYRPGKDTLEKYATDEVGINTQEYEYLLELLRTRISHISEQPGSMSRINLLEEHAFAVDLLCTLDI